MKRHVSGLLFIFCFTFTLCGEWWDGNFNWVRAKRLEEGILYAHITHTSPRLLNIWIMRVDLRKNFNFHVTGRSPEYGNPITTHQSKGLVIHTVRQTTAAFMNEARSKGIKMVAAFNTAPWSPWDRTPSKYATNLGLLVSNGVLVSPAMEGRPTFYITKNREFGMKMFDRNENISNLDQAVSGFFFSLREGEDIPSGKDLAPRTGFGLSRDKRFLYIIVVDGRQKTFSMGCTTNELGKMMRFLGAWDGINMDGGGSSSFVVWNRRNGKAEMLNHQPGGAIRPVGASLGISLGR